MSDADFHRIMEELKQDLNASLRPPEIRHAIYTGKSEGAIPGKTFVLSSSLARTPGNRFWSCWGAREDGDTGTLMMAYSDDEGQTWCSNAFEVNSGFTVHGNHISNRVGALWCDPCGKLHLFLQQTIGYFDGRSGCWESVCDDPDTAEPHWSQPVRLWHGTPLNKPCVRRNGEWILPLSLGLRKWAKFDHAVIVPDIFSELDPIRGANVIASADGGKTWQRRGFQRSTDPMFDEHHVLEKKDGTLRMYARDTYGIVSCDSADGGFTWTPFKREFHTTSARFFVTALPSGKWLMVRYATDDPNVSQERYLSDRKNLTAYLSDDDGESWYGGLLLDDRDRISYPDGFVHPDGRIFIQYDHLRENGEIVLASFREEDAAAGKNVSGEVKLRLETIR